jgi:Zn ribbon nucleic-acid-binding protein
MNTQDNHSDSLTFRDAGACTAMGRNGKMKVGGIAAVYQSVGGRVMIMPLTSRGSVGNCRIDIPVAELPDFFGMLRRITADAPPVGPQGFYLKSRGARCPACGCLDLECEMLADNGEDARRTVKCLECGAHWEDVYKLEKFVNLVHGKER